MKNKIFYLLFFAIILALSRIIPHPSNFTPILASAIMGPILIKDRLFGIALPILAMFLSDIIIGFHPYQFVVYFTILTIALISPMRKNYAIFGIMAVGASLWFFMTTNFAVWLLWDYYPKTIDGLTNCYIAAIPFFKNTLLSTLLFTGLLLSATKYLEFMKEKTINFIFFVFKKIRL